MTKLRDAVLPDVELVDALQSLIAKGSSVVFVSEPAPARFIGYTSQLEAVHTAVTWSFSAADQHVVAVGGPIGCGLTSFLRRVAAFARDRGSFSGGVYLIDLQGTLDVDSGVSSACARIGVRVSERGVTSLCAWARWLSSPTLLLIDGGRCALSKWKTVFEATASENGMLKVVVGCSGDELGGLPDVALSGLTDPDVRSLIQVSEGVGFDDETVDLIAGASRCLPAIAVHMCRQWESRPTVTPSIRAFPFVFVEESMSDDAQRFLGYLSVFPASFDVSAVVAVSGVGDAGLAVEVLGELDDAGIAHKRSDGRWFVNRRAPPVAVGDGVLASFVMHFGSVLSHAAQLYESDAVLAGLALFDVELDNLNVLFGLCEHAMEQSVGVMTALSEIRDSDILAARLSLPCRESMWRGLLPLALTLRGPGSAEYGLQLMALANVYESQGKHEEALRTFRDALEIQKVALGPRHPAVAAVLHNAANVLGHLAKHEEALAMYHEALEVHKAAFGPHHITVANSLNNIGLVLKAHLQYDQALAMYQEALEIRKATLGVRHPDVAASMLNVAAVLVIQGKYDEALHIHREVLEIRKAVLGPRHPDVAASMGSVAVALFHKGEYSEALTVSRLALDIQRQAGPGAQSGDVITLLHNIAVVLKNQSKYDEALSVAQEALDRGKAMLGPTHPDVAATMNTVATILGLQGAIGEAFVLHREALEIQKSVFGMQHPDVADTMNNIAVLLNQCAAYAESLATHREALEVRKAVCGPRHKDVASSMNNIGVLLAKQRKYDEALVMHRDALDIQKATLSPLHPDVGTSMYNIGNVLERQGKSDEALAEYQKALEIQKAALGPQHPDVATSIGSIANMFMDLKRFGEALPLYRDAVDIEKAAYGQRHPDLAVSSMNYALCLHKLGRVDEALGQFVQIAIDFGDVLPPEHEVMTKVTRIISALTE